MKMIERHEVITELTKQINAGSLNESMDILINWKLADDILSLLKEQKPVKPVERETLRVTVRYGFDCECGAPLLKDQPFCAGCGRPVKWE